MASVALNYPGCGATESIAAPHGQRICEFCGTRYRVQVVQPPARQAPDHAAESPEEARQWTNLRIIISLVVRAAFIGFMVVVWLYSSMKQ